MNTNQDYDRTQPVDETGEVGGGTPPPPPPRRLVRLPDEGPGAGIAAGLGAYFGIDPVIFRIAFVLLTVAGGGGVLLYVLAWILVPEAKPGELVYRAPATGGDQTAVLVGLGLIVIAALWIPGEFGLFSPGIVWALLLIGVGVYLFRNDAQRRSTSGDSRPQAQSAAVPPPPGGTPPGSGWSAAPARPRVEDPPSNPSFLGRLVLGAVLVGVGVLALLSSWGFLAPAGYQYVALILTILGGGLLVGSLWGRARGLIVVGILLIPLLAVSAASDHGFTVRGGGVGDREWSPTSVSQVEPRYELFAGQALLDLSDVDFSQETVEVEAGVTFGQLSVLVPADVTVEVESSAAGGELNVLGRTINGLGVNRTVTDRGREGAGTLRLDLQASFGQIEVSRSSAGGLRALPAPTPSLVP